MNEHFFVFFQQQFLAFILAHCGFYHYACMGPFFLSDRTEPVTAFFLCNRYAPLLYNILLLYRTRAFPVLSSHFIRIPHIWCLFHANDPLCLPST